MKPTYFSDSDSLLLNEDEEFRAGLEEMVEDSKKDYYTPDHAALFLFLTVDKACQITMKEFQQIMKAILIGSGAFEAVPYSDNVVVSDIPLISKLARNLNKFFLLQSIKDVDILIKKHEGEILYNACITPEKPFNADEFDSSVSHSLNPSGFPSETMCVEINKEP